MKAREEVVRDLVCLARPLHQVRAELAMYPWDAVRPLVAVKASDVVSVLDRFLDGALLSEDIEEWANAIEIRDDISFEDEATMQAVFDLANPILQGVLTGEFATQLKKSLHGE